MQPEPAFPIGVIGAGTMGTNIALSFACAGHPVHVAEVSPAQSLKCRELIDRGAALLHEHGLLRGGDSAPEVSGRIQVVPTIPEATRSAKWIIECVVENLATKHEVFAQIEAASDEAAVIASNTSTFLPSELFTALQRPERAMVMHFWNPAQLMALVEIVPLAATSASVVAEVHDHLKALGKRPILLSKDTKGFVGNRLAFALQREAMALVQQGIATPEQIDEAVKFGFGLRMPVTGVFGTADAGGLDVYLQICGLLFPHLSNRTTAPESLSALVASGRLGLKAGAGWKDYGPGEVDSARLQLEQALLEWGRTHPPKP